MFTLLVGCPPFWHRKQMIMLRNIMEGKYSFMSPEWSDISEDPKDLIRKCLVVDPEKRITVRECLKHPFFNTVVSSPARPCDKFFFSFVWFFNLLSLPKQKKSKLIEHHNTIFRLTWKFSFKSLCVHIEWSVKTQMKTNSSYSFVTPLQVNPKS